MIRLDEGFSDSKDIYTIFIDGVDGINFQGKLSDSLYIAGVRTWNMGRIGRTYVHICGMNDKKSIYLVEIFHLLNTAMIRFRYLCMCGGTNSLEQSS